MISYIIIDDEPLAHEIIEEFCGMLPHLELKKKCFSALEAIKFLNNETVDLMFLDINMPTLSGFEFLKTLQRPPKTIVISAYKEFALEGYELAIDDYLLKPYSFERFVKAVNKAINTPSKALPDNRSENKNIRFYIKGDKVYYQIKSEEILFIEAYRNYTKLYFKDKMILSHESISYYESLLPSTSFLRVHKSFIISLEQINKIEGNIIWVLEHKIPIGRIYKSTVNRLFNK